MAVPQQPTTKGKIMSRLTHLESLQLAATLLSGREAHETLNKQVEYLFNVAEKILEEDGRRNPPGSVGIRTFNL
jgi:hypothetical protein